MGRSETHDEELLHSVYNLLMKILIPGLEYQYLEHLYFTDVPEVRLKAYVMPTLLMAQCNNNLRDYLVLPNSDIVQKVAHKTCYQGGLVEEYVEGCRLHSSSSVFSLNSEFTFNCNKDADCECKVYTDVRRCREGRITNYHIIMKNAEFLNSSFIAALKSFPSKVIDCYIPQNLMTLST
jgi:hypothetical protein